MMIKKHTCVAAKFIDTVMMMDLFSYLMIYPSEGSAWYVKLYWEKTENNEEK